MTRVMQNHHLAVQYTPPKVANLDQILTILRPIQTRYSQIWTTGGGRQILLSFTAERRASAAAGSRSDVGAEAIGGRLQCDVRPRTGTRDLEKRFLTPFLPVPCSPRVTLPGAKQGCAQREALSCWHGGYFSWQRF